MNVDKKKDNEPLKEFGKAILGLGSLIGGLSFVNVFLTQAFNIFQVIIVLYTVIVLYKTGFNIIERSLSDE